jgi:hypothetical protein
MRSSRSLVAKAPGLAVAATLLALAPAAHAQSGATGAAPMDVAGSWHPGDPIPRSYHQVYGARSEIISLGATMFALPYLASALVATTGYPSDSASSSLRSDLWIPAAGPFIQIGNTHTAAGDVFLALDGLVQLGGIAVFVYGVATPTAVIVPDAPTPAPAPKAAQLSIAPFVTGRATGAAVVGTF